MKYFVDFSGWLAVDAKSEKDAIDIFWDWVDKIQEDTPYNYHGVVLETPTFERKGVKADEG